MCGRFTSAYSQDELIDAFDIKVGSVDLELLPDFNLAPTRLAPVVVASPAPNDPSAQAVRQLRNLRWGLIPSWMRNRPKGPPMINARAETITQKPSFRTAFASRRALVPAGGFYEWLAQTENPSARTPKQPYYLRPSDGGMLVMAGIHELWRDPSQHPGSEGAWLATFAIITTSSTDDVGRIHDRMPMTVESQYWDDWLDPRLPSAEAESLMRPPQESSLEIFPVSTAVNNIGNNGPELILPLP